MMPADVDLPPSLRALPRIRLAHLPTPLHELPRLSRTVAGPRILIKRDDLTGLATGGNKARKLEFLLAAALRENADCLITAGGAQSNHCRQTAAAAASAGLKCHLVLGGTPSGLPRGNLFLDQLLGAEIHWVDKPQRNERMRQLAAKLCSQGERPYIVPIGGSNALGAIGYVQAMFELVEQLRGRGEEVDHIYVGSSSGGTLAGMLLGARLADFSGEIIAISIDQHAEDGFPELVTKIANEAADLLGSHERISPADVQVVYDYLGDGYGVVGPLERDAIRQVARCEGILLGPVYTGRAAGGMLDLIRRGQIGGEKTILFWHTGDETALHGYVETLGDFQQDASGQPSA